MNFKAKDLIFIALIILIVAAFLIFIVLKDSNGTGSTAADNTPAERITASVERNYVGNINNHKLHSINCGSLPYEQNRVYFATIEEATKAGYTDKHKECMGR